VAGIFLIALGLGLYYSHAALNQEYYMQITRGVYSLQKWAATVENARLAATPWKTLDPLATPVAFFEGMGLQNCGEEQEAIKALELARKQNPNRIHIVNNLGILYAKNQNFAKAIECFSLSIKRYPDRTESYENLAACYMDMGDFSYAVKLLEGIPAERQTVSSRSALELARIMLANATKIRN
jgi:tetratricopeptide (TPR) repeat protein